MPDGRHSPYGIAGRAAGEAVLEHGRDGARLRPADDAFLLSRIARAVVDALHAEEPMVPLRLVEPIMAAVGDDPVREDLIDWILHQEVPDA